MAWIVIALLSLIWFWVALVVLITRWPRELSKSISQHAAASKQAYTFFTITQVIVGITTYWFIIAWYIPRFHLSLWFGLIYSLTAGLQVASALIPDNMTGISSKVHVIMANTMAMCLPLVVIMLLFSPYIVGSTRYFFMATAAYMLLVIFLLVIKSKQVRANYLIWQMVYIVLFQAVILYSVFAS